MHVFLVLSSISILASAKPQYNYGSGISGSFEGIARNNRNSAGFNGLAGLGSGRTIKLQDSNGESLSSGSIGRGSVIGIGSLFGSASNGGAASFVGPQRSLNYNQYSQHQQHHSTQFETPFVHKQFITVSAPEDNENFEETKHFVIGRPQKNYRVVFIKAPSSSNSNVKLSAEYAPQEEKTVIYVLSKKDSSLEVSDIATPAPTVPSKPEVFFIKYKTEAEAQHAQKQIQAEYDTLEGTSEHTDGGVAPQHSVVGILDGSNASNINSIDIGSGNVAKSAAYLPPAGH